MCTRILGWIFLYEMYALYMEIYGNLKMENRIHKAKMSSEKYFKHILIKTNILSLKNIRKSSIDDLCLLLVICLISFPKKEKKHNYLNLYFFVWSVFIEILFGLKFILIIKDKAFRFNLKIEFLKLSTTKTVLILSLTFII